MALNEPRTGHNETVLVVEDEVIVRMNISEYLRQCGYKVIEAAHADEALVVLKDKSVQVDLVFADLQTSGTMDGFALSRWVRQNRPEIDILLAGTIDRATEKAAEICEDGPLPKPYHPQLLLDRIKRLRARRPRG